MLLMSFGAVLSSLLLSIMVVGAGWRGNSCGC